MNNTTGHNQSYLHTLTAGVYVPVMQAGIVGLVFTLAGLMLSLWARWRSWPMVSLGCGLVGFAVMWGILQRHWILLTLERLTGQDLDGDGRVADLSPLSQRRESLRVYVSEVTQQGHVTGNAKIYDLPCTSQELTELARGILEEGAPFSERYWTGAGRPFSVGGFRELRGEFIRRGLVSLASPKDARQGYCLTVAGRHVLAAILAELSPSPSDLGE